MADNSQGIYPYPLMFDPSQFKNKYQPAAFNNGVPTPPTVDVSGTGDPNDPTTQGPTNAFGQVIPYYQQQMGQLNADYQKALAAYNAQPGPSSTTPATSGGTTGTGSANDLMAAFSPAGLAANPNSRQVTIDGHTGYQANMPPGQMSPYDAAVRQASGMVGAMTNYANPNTGQRGGTYTPGPNLLGMTSAILQGMPQQQQQPQTQGKGPAPTPPSSWNTYLQALSRPQHIDTPGATATSPTVLSSFLQKWNPTATG